MKQILISILKLLQRKLQEPKRDDVIIATTYVLDMVAKNLAREAIDNRRTLEEAIDKQKVINDLLINNKGVYDKNVELLKKNSTELFHVKECTIWLYKHYSRVLSIIDNNLLADENLAYQVSMARMEIANGLRVVETYFLSTFGVHPADYIKSKINIVGQKADGSNFASSASVN